MRPFILALPLLLAAGPALAVTVPEPPAHPAVQHPVRHALHKTKPTTGHPIAAPSPDPNAGMSENGMPNGAVTNGGQLGH